MHQSQAAIWGEGGKHWDLAGNLGEPVKLVMNDRFSTLECDYDSPYKNPFIIVLLRIILKGL